MTKRKNRDLQKLGYTIRNLREQLSLRENTRSFFLEDRSRKHLIQDNDISEKTLMNIENGYTLPSLSTLKILATALEVDFIELIKKIEEYIP